MFPQLDLGPLVIPSAGLVYILGAWIALSVVERAAKALGVDAERTYSLGAALLAAGFIGARLVFVVLHWSAYRENLVGIVWPLTSGFDPWGGLSIAAAAGLFYGRARQLPPWETLDALAPGLVLGLMALSLADFLAGPGYGTESGLPWAIDVFGIRRHPVQVYELLVGTAALLAWRRLRSQRQYPGQLFLALAAIYSGGRLFLDAFRANAWLTDSGLHIIQIISLAVLLLAVYLIGRRVPAVEIDRQSPV